MSSGEMLQERERLLALQCGLDGPRRRFNGEDLECEDLAEVEHWVRTYTELVEFTRSVLAESSAADLPPIVAADQTPADLRPLMLQAQVQELHLSYWAERLARLRATSASDGQQTS